MQSVFCEAFLGLVTNAAPEALPEGASPLNWDVDYLIGSVFTRPGLVSSYTLTGGFTGNPFYYIKSYALSNGDLHSIALDSAGQLWDENVVTAPGVLTKLSPLVIPGSHAFSVTEDDVEYICFSDLTQGTDIPRQYNVHPASGAYTLDRVSQVGPGAPPTFQSSSASGAAATITSWAGVGSTVTFQAVNSFIAGEVVVLSGFATSTFFNGLTAIVLGTGLSGTQFEITFSGYSGSTDTGIATPQFSYPIQSITQPSIQTTQDLLQSAGPGSTSNGSVVTVYYNTVADNFLINQFNSGVPVYVYITNAVNGVGNGTQLITGIGVGTPPGAGAPRYYFTFTANGVTHFQAHSGAANYQLTVGTVVTQVAIPSLVANQLITVSGATPINWNNTWVVEQILNAGVYNITQTSMTSGTATYSWTWAGSGTAIAPVSGQLVTVVGCTNGNGVFNVTDAAIATVTGGPSSGTFTITGFVSPNVSAAPESGQAQTFGTKFQIDPGSTTIGTTQNPIYGNDSGTGTVSITGSSPIASGTRQAVVFFETRNGFKTPCSAPVTFTTSQTGTSIIANSIPLGPPNVIRRWLAFTVAGQNGIPGPNFYSIDAAVTTKLNGQTVTYTPTYINDNISTTASFVFTDAVLLAGDEIDVQGNDLFNEIELGSSAWNITYASRMFYGLEQDKVLNFTNLTFDGGYLPSAGANLIPLGWNLDNVINTTTNSTVVVSSVFGNAYYILNNSGSTQTNFGMITQNAFQDAFNVPIILPNALYSVRVYASIPSGSTTGTLIVDLTQSNVGLASGTGTATGYGITFGTFSLPFASMTTVPKIYTGTLLTTPFTAVPSSLVLRVWAQNIANAADVQVERIEVYPTYAPILTTNIRVSYVDNFEAFDGVTGNIGLAAHDTNPCFGAVIIHDQLYFLQSTAMQSTQDIPGVEPSGPGGGWPVHEVSNRVGACGIYAYDYGEEWLLTGCRNGVYGFNGGQPIRIDFQQKELWELINWKYGNSIIVRNDLPNRRILAAVPLPTPNKWLPSAPTNANPTFPNVMIMWNYHGLGDFQELVTGRAVHTTMFGTLAAVDMRLKASIWQIPTHYMGFVKQADLVTLALVICGA